MAEFEKKSQQPAEGAPINWRWEPSDKFILTGVEFELIYNGLIAQMQDPILQRARHTIKALEVAEGILKQGIDAGVVKPVYPQYETPIGLEQEDESWNDSQHSS